MPLQPCARRPRPARHLIAALVSALAVATLVAACGPGQTDASHRGTTATTPSQTPQNPSGTASSSTSSTTPAAEGTVGRTSAELKKALLSPQDVPSGFAVDPPSKNDGGLGASSNDPKCAAFVRLSNATRAPGSTATADVAYTGGQNGPGVQESLDALGTRARVAALQASVKTAIAACPRVTIAVPGAGKSIVTVRPVSPPAYGRSPLAARLTATSGPLAGAEFTLLSTGVGDTVLSMTFIGLAPGDIDAATSGAVQKAAATLGVTGASGT